MYLFYLIFLFRKTNYNLFTFQLVPSLLQVLDDNANPRVQAHGAAALVNFSEECPKAILSQYLDVIILKLEEVLNSKFKEVRVLNLCKCLCMFVRSMLSES